MSFKESKINASGRRNLAIYKFIFLSLLKSISDVLRCYEKIPNFMARMIDAKEGNLQEVFSNF